jgi:uncharacterized membrane protein YgcG
MRTVSSDILVIPLINRWKPFMKKLAFLACATFLAFSAPAFSKGSKGSSGLSYGGGKHSSSHSGTYVGGSGSSHKGGTYVNSRSGNAYGKHK